MKFAAMCAFLPCLAFGQVDNVKINELFTSNASYTNSDGSLTDLVELYNTGAIEVNLIGCSFSDSNAFPTRYIVPDNLIIPPFGRYVLRCTSSQPPSTTNLGFGLKASGGFLYFYKPGGVANDQIQYGLQTADYSVGRVPDGTGAFTLNSPTLGAANVAVPLGSPTELRVNEWLAAQSSSGPKDYFELYNTTNVPVLLGGLHLTDDALVPGKFTVAPLSFIGIGPQAYVRFVADGTVTTPTFPADQSNFKLSASGESVRIYTADASPLPLDFVVFGVQTNDISQGRLPDGSTNIVYFTPAFGYATYSPGSANFKIMTNVIVNELLSHTDPPQEDAVEFQNLGSTNVNISGWWLSNQRSNPKRYQIPTGAALTPGGFRVIYEGVGATTGFNSTNAASPFTFNSAHGDNIVLSEVDGNGNLTGYIVYEEFESAANGFSFGHYNTSVPGDYKFVAMSARSFGVGDALTVQEFRTGTGQTNPFPRVGPVVINEIMFLPLTTMYINTNSILVTGQNPKEEFIELRNITATNVLFYDPNYPTNRWRLQKAINFEFPRTNLPPNSFCLVVGFDPYTDSSALSNFRTRYGVSNNVPIFGPWIGQLNNNGDAVELYRPDPVQLPPHPDAGYVPYIRVDKVNYLSTIQWPSVGTNTGKSLQRKNSILFGNDPLNWAADAPNAGMVSLALQDTDGDGIPDAWETSHGLNPNSAADAPLDPDGDGVSNYGEYLAGTDPHNASSVLRIGGVIPFIGTNVPLYVVFLAYSNATYSVEYRNSLLPSSAWQKLGDVNSATSNRVVDVPDANAYKKSDRYYRVIAPASN